MTMQASKNKIQFIHFLVQNVHLCFEIQYIKKVLPMVELKPLPNGPAYFAGFINIADKSLPTIDLALRLGLKRQDQYTLATPIIICTDDSHEVGIIVDEILGLTIADKNSMQMQRNFSDPESLFRAIIPLDGKLALVLNMQQILTISMTTDNKKSAFDINSVNLTGFKYD